MILSSCASAFAGDNYRLAAQILKSELLKQKLVMPLRHVESPL
jgi:hypothetical protein